jgi:hypothetical protein
MTAKRWCCNTAGLMLILLPSVCISTACFAGLKLAHSWDEAPSTKQLATLITSTPNFGLAAALRLAASNCCAKFVPALTF